MLRQRIEELQPRNQINVFAAMEFRALEDLPADADDGRESDLYRDGGVSAGYYKCHDSVFREISRTIP